MHCFFYVYGNCNRDTADSRFFYTYTKLLGKDIFILDLGTFVLSTIIAFFAAYKFALVPKMQSYTRFLDVWYVCCF